MNETGLIEWAVSKTDEFLQRQRALDIARRELGSFCRQQPTNPGKRPVPPSPEENTEPVYDA